MAPGGKTIGAIRRKKYSPLRLKEDLKHHLKLELSFNHAMKRVEVELLWKDDPDVPDYIEEPEVLARAGLFIDMIEPMSDKEENRIWQQIGSKIE